ncbi:Lipase-like pad4 [Castilleja foliolosa]|uniref:Lipase-like pad4 n=1 Tax=Castilleja foliolosa TaxID=1961234 RepID=A0ABD3CNS7_9LAMI
MEPQISLFESSEMLATYLASTPLLEESWRMCHRANAAAQQSFAVDREGKVAYVAFSGVQEVDCSEESSRGLVELEIGGAKGIFGGFGGGDDGKEPIMVHGGLLQLFLIYHSNPNFQLKMLEILNECKSVVFTGHSLGGALASLSALWLLSVIRNNSPSIEVLCVTFGSPMLGNQSFSRAILQERWDGNFFHVVAQNDIVPRLLFAPTSPFMDQIRALVEFWQLSMASSCSTPLAPQLSYEDMAELFGKVLACVKERLKGGEDQVSRSSYWPFGSYMFCTRNGAICLDNGMAIVKLLYLMLLGKGCVNSCVEDHLKYEYYVGQVCWQFLQKKSLTGVCLITESSNEAGIAMALQSSGINFQEPIYGAAKNCLAMASQSGCRRSLNNAKMAVSLSKITPLRAQIEWYKAFCDDSDDQLGYYDSFKRRSASKKGSKVNMNCIRLGKFWDEVINMLETNQLTHDFHKLPKYVNAARFYKLLVEPLDIAEYYRTGMHTKKGHYIEHGRERRFKVFDKWWRDRKVGDEESNPRSKFAGLTQDPCFWARVEVAIDYMNQITSEVDSSRHFLLLEKVEGFERYALGMIERKEVSVDVLAKNSSYNLFTEEWKALKSQLQLMPIRFSTSQDGKVQEIRLEADDTFMSGFS